MFSHLVFWGKCRFWKIQGVEYLSLYEEETSHRIIKQRQTQEEEAYPVFTKEQLKFRIMPMRFEKRADARPTRQRESSVKCISSCLLPHIKGIAIWQVKKIPILQIRGRRTGKTNIKTKTGWASVNELQKQEGAAADHLRKLGVIDSKPEISQGRLGRPSGMACAENHGSAWRNFIPLKNANINRLFHQNMLCFDPGSVIVEIWSVKL